MSKRLMVVLALLFVVGIAFTAYAEVQNVKVSGDIVMSGLSRHKFNLVNSAATGSKSQWDQKLFMSQIRLRVDADLTDNVMATVRLINERVWNGQNDTAASGNDAIGLDLAYVTLKEFLYSPLSLTIGRQEIHFGNGLVMGNAKVITSTAKVNIPSDLTERKAFDAIRATLNYDPLVLDFIYAKIRQETTVNDTVGDPNGTRIVSNKDDINLAGINATYALTKKTNVSAYYYNKRDNATNGGLPARGKSDQVNTVGLLLSSTPIENLTGSLEGAYQFGRNSTSAQDQHKAYALQAMLDYTFAKVKTTPKLGASYTYLSGNRSAHGADNAGWDPMFYDQKLNNITYTLLPFANMSVFNLKASCKPMDDVTLFANFGSYDVAQERNTANLVSPFTYNGTNTYLTSARTGRKHLGDALDLTVTYDYTEDVQLALTGGWFAPGPALTVNDKSATQLIGSMKVTF